MNISVHISMWAVRASNRDTALALGTWLLAFVRNSVRDARAPALESQERQEQQFKQNPYILAHDVARLAAVFASMILPSLIAYRLACWQADREYRVSGWRRTTVAAHLTDVFADRFSEEEKRRLTREYLRLRNCDDVDVRKLAGRRGTFRPLMEIRGLEHLQRALADGHGALILAAHCGSFAAATARLGAEGLPVSVTRLPFGEMSRSRRNSLDQSVCVGG
jgi:lauroyl/myristoyl acyltransferase